MSREPACPEPGQAPGHGGSPQDRVPSPHPGNRLVDEAGLREPTALSAWAEDLLRRARGLSSGPAILVLWRTCVWNAAGSPKKGFEVTAEAVRGAECALREAVVAAAQP